MTSRPPAEQHLLDLARLRRVRDRIDREYAQPVDVEALARGAHMSAGHPQPRVPAAPTPCGDTLGFEVRNDVGYVRDCAFRDPAGNHIRINELR